MIDNPSFESVLESHKPLVMGIINLTPDSFFGDGLQTMSALKDVAITLQNAGVDIVDIGAESSRPGARAISSDEEIHRLSDAVAVMRQHCSAFISVDTYKPETARHVLNQGADIINDISGGESDALLAAVASHNAAVVLMHKQGDALTMQDNPQYQNVVDDVYDWLERRVQKARAFGISTVLVDPGIGFGKTVTHNCLLLKHLNRFTGLGCPIVIGTSNKSFIGHICNAKPKHRFPGSIASAIDAFYKGARVFRVHHASETVQAFQVIRAINE